MKIENFTRNDQEQLRREKINSDIESIQCGIDEKIELLLVIHNAKPVGDIDYVISSQEDEEVFNRDMSILRELNLVLNVVESDAHVDDALQNEKVMDIHFSSQKESMDSLMQRDEENYNVVFGKAYGFPDTAIEAFRNMDANNEGELPYNERSFVWRRELPDSIKQSEIYPYITFGILSKDNWREEIKTAQRWKDTIREVNPKLHGEYLKWAREEWLNEEIS